jgi:myosin heavy subunit
MNVMGLTEQEQSNILQVVAGVLHLGNVMFREKGNYSEIEDQDSKFMSCICIRTNFLSSKIRVFHFYKMQYV